MGQTELRSLIESLIPKANKTQDGSIICPFCHVPQKQISSHIKKDHDGQMQEHCKTKDSEEYMQELKRYLAALRREKCSADQKLLDPVEFKRKQASRREKCSADKKLLDPVEFKRKQAEKRKEYLKRLSDANKTREKEYHKKYDKVALIKSKTWEAAKKRFHQETLYGPVFECVCCRTMCFRHQVVPYTEQAQEKIRTKAKAAAERQMKDKNANLLEDLLAKMSKVSVQEQQNSRLESGISPSESKSREPEEPLSQGSKYEEFVPEDSKSEDPEPEPESGGENEDGVLASYHRWFERCDEIYDTLGKCQGEADALGLRETYEKLVDCDDTLWDKREWVIETYDQTEETVRKSLIVHQTEEQEKSARVISETLDGDEDNQKVLLELTMNFLGLLKKGKKEAQTKRQHLANIRERDRGVDELFSEIDNMFPCFAPCKCQVLLKVVIKGSL